MSGLFVLRPLPVVFDTGGDGFGDLGLAGAFGIAAGLPGDLVGFGLLFFGGRPALVAAFGRASLICNTAFAAASSIAATIRAPGSGSSSEPGMSSRVASSSSPASAMGSSSVSLFFFFFDFFDFFDFDRCDFFDLLRLDPGLEDDEELVESDEETEDDDDDEDDDVSIDDEDELDECRCFFLFFE